MDALFDSFCSGVFCDVLGVWLAALLTILVFTYLVRDTFLFRIASALLVGTAIGFVSAIVIRDVLIPQIVRVVGEVAALPESSLTLVIDLIPLLLGLSLLIKLTPSFRNSTVSNLGLAYLFGIGAALAIGGALSGALAPQIVATMIPIVPGEGFDWINSLLIVIGTLGAFLAFRFIQPGAGPGQRVYDAITKSWGTLGRGFIMIAFGALLASLITARVSTLVGQLYFLLHDWLHLI